MEKNPTLDFGSPGPLVHFVEKYYRNGYEPELLASVSRRPIVHTVWMLNRLINGTKEADLRNKYIDALKAAAAHPEASAGAKKRPRKYSCSLPNDLY
jgi:hypothetical protein